VTADFLCILAAFSAFVIGGLYPFWILLLIVAMFVQFLLTSKRGRPVYDPVGKYYGAFLFTAIGITLAFPNAAVCLGLFITLIGLTAMSLLSRISVLRTDK
jgi:CDP-diacylglycerol--glycerol-3-phosphate 3-phosphatidyltransferase/cardiolipin synthase